ncbi:MAG TPA: hypothetical protein DD658_04120 [Deltaproteobacteria bacterium]|nr:hypothetical protein [Deltaproteobacteria bacterium]
MVLSTLHTNDSASAVTRLVDMGIEPFLVASSLTAVIAQRLVRRLCFDCRVPYSPSPEQWREIGLAGSPSGSFYQAPGCPACMSTGYRGRAGIFEILVVDDRLRALILTRADSEGIREHALARGMRTILASGAAKVREGITSVEEVLRVTREE